MPVTPKISIIVPIYKVEKYLRQCIDSILSQTFKDFELILVDDGSPDSCPFICDEYASLDCRIKVIHQPNSGLGKAYNTGIASARANYIGLIESDDWIEPEMYETLYKEAFSSGADLVKCNFYDYNSFRTPADVCYRNALSIPFQNIAPQGISFKIEDFPLLLVHHPSIWAALYKKSFIQKIPFLETPGAAYQDFSFSAESLCLADKIRLIYKPLLHYRREMGQNSSNKQRNLRLLEIGKQIQHSYAKISMFPSFDKIAEAFFYHAAETAIYFFHQILPAYRKEYIHAMAKVFSPLQQMPHFSFTYFSEREKYFTLAFIAEDLNKAVDLLYDTRELRLFSIPLYQRKKNSYERHIKILGIPVYTKLQTNETACYYVLGLPGWHHFSKHC